MLTRLREATRDAHRAIEAAVFPGGRAFEREAYLRYLAKQHGLLAPLEPLLDFAWLAIGLSPSPRRKAALVSEDLTFAGVNVAALPACADLPEVVGLSRALGCLYVLEGQTLGARVLFRSVRGALGVSRSRGATFLEGYGDATAERWQELTAALEKYARLAPGEAPLVVEGAIETFELMHHWLERA